MCVVVVVQSFFAQNKSQHYCLGVINEFLAACNFFSFVMVSQETYCIKIKHSFENTFANLHGFEFYVRQNVKTASKDFYYKECLLCDKFSKNATYDPK